MKRVPVILQMTPNECGASCLAMILTFYGRETTVGECREHLHSGRDGVTAREIAQTARDFGLRVKAYSLEADGLAQVQTPAIIHWRFDHFLVLERWTPRHVQVVDPAVGRQRLSAEEFSAGFTGVVLTLEPGASFQQQRSRYKLSWRGFAADLLRMPGTSGLLVQILLASALLLLLGLVFPLFTMVLVDTILPAQDYGMLTILGIGMVVLVVAQVILGYLRSALALYLEARLDVQVMLGFFEHVLMLPYRFFQERTSGDLLMRLGSISVIRDVLTSQMISAILDGAMVFIYLIILLIWWPFFGMLTLIFGAAQVLLIWRTTSHLYGLTERDLAAQAESQSYLVEALTGVATLKAAAAENRALDHWSDLFFKQLNISLKRSHATTLVETGRDAIESLAPILLLWAGALWVLNDRMSLGAMLAVTTLAISFLGPLASLVTNGQQLQLIGAHLDRIADVLNSTPEQELSMVENAPALSGRIDLSEASFRYHTNAPWAVNNVSITIKPGQKVALVGPTGSGKSTLAMLLLGLYPLDHGEIRYDGRALSTLNYHTVRRQFGVVLQEPTLFSGSIRDNISLHDPSLSLAQIESAARLAAIHNEIATMPMGYETIVAEGGADMAGGQRQRLALARALVHEPAILLLDEATSHLDAVTERIVDNNLNGLNCTRIVIAHRLNTVRNADTILVLKEGVIVEQGTHEELLALGRAYAELVRDQNTMHGWGIAD